MKLAFQKETLVNGINIVSKAIPSKTTMNILECILIDASSNEIRLTGNDMELGIETKVEGSILEKGKLALEAKIFSDIIRKLPDSDADVTIASDERYNTTIECDGAIFRIQGRDPQEFSYLPFIEKNEYICISQFSLKEAVRQTIFSTAPNDSNKMMGGELVEVKDNVLKVVSLDGHRISIRNILLKHNYENQKIIIPGKTLSEISKILSGDNEKEVQIYFSKNHILFEFEDTKVISRLIEGEYFKIDHMLSNDYKTHIKVNKKIFMDHIDRAMIMIRDNDRKPIILKIEENNVNMKIRSSFGSMNANVAAQKTGDDITIAFNPKFLLDALRVIDDEEADIYMMNPKSPCFIKDDAGNYIYLILPVNFIDED
ncbi:DNA polymerase III subunit beta [Clostridiaceae bacterium]|nr:DNA polymerase III subunit beta [Clostridiaceae bacterium]RKI15994.1 DNA polymerase III subunit beta [bacterium 1XD21-70]